MFWPRFPQSSWVLALAALAALAPRAAAQGGTDFYHVERLSGVSWLIAPNRSRQLLLGLDHVHLVSASAPRTDLAPAYVDQRAAQILAGMHRAGFNALGGDADADLWHRGLPYVESLDLSRHLQADQQTPFLDVFAPDFVPRLQALASTACAPRARDPELIGYFSDDGLSWDPGRPGQAEALFRYFLALPVSAAGRRQAMDYLRQRYNSDIGRVSRAWGVKARDFLQLAAPASGAGPAAAFATDAAGFAQAVLLRYLGATAAAIQTADPNHLFLGANLEPAAAAATWTAATVTSVAVADAVGVQALVARLATLPPHPFLLRVSGCGTPPDLRPLLDAANIGWFWSPTGDWQSGACAQTLPAWTTMNSQAAAAHAAR